MEVFLIRCIRPAEVTKGKSLKADNFVRTDSGESALCAAQATLPVRNLKTTQEAQVIDVIMILDTGVGYPEPHSGKGSFIERHFVRSTVKSRSLKNVDTLKAVLAQAITHTLCEECQTIPG